MARPKKNVDGTKTTIKKPRKTIEDKIAALEAKLEMLKNKPDKDLIKKAVKVLKGMTKDKIEAFIQENTK